MSKRFVTYRTEDAKAGLINVDENGVLKAGGGGGDTSDSTTNVCFIIDGEQVEMYKRGSCNLTYQQFENAMFSGSLVGGSVTVFDSNNDFNSWSLIENAIKHTNTKIEGGEMECYNITVSNGGYEVHFFTDNTVELYFFD